jgi:uncharacterized membrane protein
MPSDFYVGVALNLVGSVFINLGTNVVKLAHLQESGRTTKLDELFVKLGWSTWSAGVATFVCGNIINFISFSFAAQSLLAALGSVQFVSNVLFSVTLLRERVTSRTLLATSLIVFGNFFIVGNSSKTSRSWTADELLELYSTPRYQSFVLVMVVIVLSLHWVYVSVTRAGYTYDDCFRVIPFSYAAVSAIIGSQSVLLAKSTSELVRSTLQGQDQFTRPFSYVILLGWVLTMMFWLYRMNTALRRYDALFIVPVLQVIWTLCSIVGGGLYFDEFANFSFLQGFMFIAGVMLVICGVFVLAVQRTPSASEASSDECGDVCMEDHEDLEMRSIPASPPHSPEKRGVGLLYNTLPRSYFMTPTMMMLPPSNSTPRHRSGSIRMDIDTYSDRGHQQHHNGNGGGRVRSQSSLSSAFDSDWLRSNTPSFALALPLFDCDTNPLIPPFIEITEAAHHGYSMLETTTRVAHF